MSGNPECIAGGEKKRQFIKPCKAVAVDLAIFFGINSVIMYVLLIFIPESTLAMISTIWVIIIAWRGGVSAAVLGSVVIYLSNFLSMHLPPHANVPINFYFNNKVPGFVIGFAQALIAGGIVGYISTLVHRLRNEVALRKKMQEELEQKVAELNTFGHTVAHDLKNPLMIINMAVSTLANDTGASGSDKAEKMVSFIQGSTVTMMNIIESLLTFAGLRSINGKKFSTVMIEDCVDAALHRLAYSIEHEKVHIEKPDKWPLVYGHGPWLTEVLVNYINNAIKYGGNPVDGLSPRVELGFDLPGTYPSARNGHARFWVKDNGDGIPQEKIGSLFREFSRLHSSRYEGHGLGLSIVKSVMEKLDGTVGVEPNNNRGSCFYFTLPVASGQST